MALKNIGQNSAEEFFETLIYMVAYDEARDMISSFTDDIENPYLKEAVESASNVIVFGGIFMIIQYEEQLIERVFNLVSGVVTILMNVPKKSISKLKLLRGRKFRILGSILGNFSSDSVNKANVIVNQLSNFIQGRNNQYQSMNLVGATQDIRKTVFFKEDMRFKLGNAMASRYNETLLFKLFTSTFTDRDKAVLKKILGTYDPNNLDIEQINKISEFMFVKDDNGKVVGLSEAFFELINGLGYVNK